MQDTTTTKIDLPYPEGVGSVLDLKGDYWDEDAIEILLQEFESERFAETRAVIKRMGPDASQSALIEEINNVRRQRGDEVALIPEVRA